ncbi:MAG: hypothetical protein B6U94_08680 [Thermofilum sp. ex4484_79]|nr:MAG: hypothetical protein B6U94_08680 [Thermofilum sp. ex4484_79]
MQARLHLPVTSHIIVSRDDIRIPLKLLLIESKPLNIKVIPYPLALIFATIFEVDILATRKVYHV